MENQTGSAQSQLSYFITGMETKLNQIRSLQDTIYRSISKLHPPTPEGTVCEEQEREPVGYLERMEYLLNKADDILEKHGFITKSLNDLL